MTGLTVGDLGPVWCLAMHSQRGNFKRTQEEFHRLGLDCSPWYDDHSLSPPPPDDWGFNRNSWFYQHTFRRLITMARWCNWRSILVVEDDVSLSRSIVDRLANSEIPDDWELLSLGSYHLWSEPTLINPDVLRMNGSHSTQSIAIRSEVFDRILSEPISTTADQQLADTIHPRGRSYCVWPALSIQRPGVSAVTGEFTDCVSLYDYQSRSDFERKNPTWSG